MQAAPVDGGGELWHSLAHRTIMFSLLADKLDNTFRRLRGLGKISEKNIADAMRDIRLALLEADVEFGVARDFIARVKERAMGQEVLKSIKPGEQIVKIFRDEIASLLGGDAVGLDLTDPARIMVVGLNGAAPCWWPATWYAPPPLTSWLPWRNRSRCPCTSPRPAAGTWWPWPGKPWNGPKPRTEPS